MRCPHVILLLASHQKSFLILLLQEHQLHLIVLKGMVAALGGASSTHSRSVDAAEVYAVHCLAG